MRVFSLPENVDTFNYLKYVAEKHLDDYDFVIAHKKGENILIFTYDDIFVNQFLSTFDDIKEEKLIAPVLWQTVINQGWPLFGNENLIDDFSE